MYRTVTAVRHSAEPLGGTVCIDVAICGVVGAQIVSTGSGRVMACMIVLLSTRRSPLAEAGRLTCHSIMQQRCSAVTAYHEL